MKKIAFVIIIAFLTFGHLFILNMIEDAFDFSFGVSNFLLSLLIPILQGVITFLGYKISEELSEVEDNEHMRQGRDLEDYCARRFSEATGLRNMATRNISAVTIEDRPVRPPSATPEEDSTSPLSPLLFYKSKC